MQENNSGIYFIESTDKIKIGISDNIRRRLVTIRMDSSEPAYIIAVISEKNQEKAREIELTIHKQFQHLWSHGEWFFITSELLDHISTVAIIYDPSMTPKAKKVMRGLLSRIKVRNKDRDVDEILGFIKTYYKKWTKLPTTREVMSQFNVGYDKYRLAIDKFLREDETA